MRILVATVALEEGLDVSDCQFVVRYSKFHVPKSHIQGSGRARHRDAEIFYFENDPTTEKDKAAEMRQCALDTSLSTSTAERMAHTSVAERTIEGFHPFKHGGGGSGSGGLVNIYNCVEIFHTYCSRVLGQSLNLAKSGILVYRIEKIRSVLGEVRKHLTRVRYPCPEGYFDVRLEDVDAHWGDHGVNDAIVPGRPLKTAADKELHRFVYTVVVKMHAAGYLMADNQPSARAIAETKAAIEGIRLEDEFHLQDKFAPDALELEGQPAAFMAASDGATSGVHCSFEPLDSSLSAEAPLAYAAQLAEDAAASNPAAPAPTVLVESIIPPPVVEQTANQPEDFKSRLNLNAQLLWVKSGGPSNLRYTFEREGPPHQPTYRATVRLVPFDESFTGGQAMTKKNAEQAAAEAALPRMMQALQMARGQW